jgi:hypothetical protein
MSLTRSAIEAMAPDQSALSAASKLLSADKWPTRARAGGLIWGECQGSGANPYRVVADTEDPGSKCTCPSRKFPCKHALALMWMFVEDGAAFITADVPDWVKEWMGRRRKSTVGAPQSAGGKSLEAARAAEPAEAPDPEAEARRAAASAKRAADTERSARAATEDLDIWIADQLRTGVMGFLADLNGRCRRIAARLVDAKAGALASRIDEMPARLLSLTAEERVDAAIAELGKLVVLTRAWRAEPNNPDLRREVIASEARDDVLANPATLRVTSTWEVLGERISTRRDGLVSQTAWLLNVGQPAEQRFALLLDFFPASAGRRAGAFSAGDVFTAELAFYPAIQPMRAVIVSRGDATTSAIWPMPPADPFAEHADRMLTAPWTLASPLLLPEGRLCIDAAGRSWWRSKEDMWAQLSEAPPPLALGALIERAVGLWDGARLSLVAARTNWGRLTFDG